MCKNPTGRNAQERSGNPGYNHGRPVISGRWLNVSGFSWDPDGGPKLWRPAASSLCRDAAAETADFGVDVASSCAVQLSAENFTDCEALETTIENLQV